MSVPLQQFEHDRSVYDRPGERWRCGHAGSGHVCAQGPDASGRCRTTHACRPIRRGDRWQCTRSPAAGGPCAAGPLPDGTCVCPVPPCQPVLTHRSRRRLVVFGACALTIGVLLLAIGHPARGRFLSPGRLSSVHAELETSCASCHSAGDLELAGVLRASWATPSIERESGKCLVCHALGPDPLAPHGLDPERLGGLTASAARQSADDTAPVRVRLAAQLFGTPGPDDPMACSLCHVEHRGRDAGLADMTASRCQGCHERPFHSFAEGHPDFAAEYPTRRRTRIAFNHKTHYGDHFETEGWSGECRTCHVPDASATHFLLRDFETTCGSCHHHLEQLSGTTLSDPLITVFGLPAVDLDSLTAGGVWIGDDWPADASVGDEMALSPFLRMLLAADEAAAADLAMLSAAGVTLLDLSGADDATRQAAGRLVWSIKAVLDRLTRDEGSPWRDRIAEAFEGPSEVELDALTGQPRDRPQETHRQWRWNVRRLCETYLPNLQDELAAYHADPGVLHREPPPPPAPREPAPATEQEGGDDLLGDDGGDDLLGDDGDDDLLGDDGGDDLLDEDQDDDLLDEDQDDDLLDEDQDDDLLGDDSDEPEPDAPATPPADLELERRLETLQRRLDEFMSDLGSGGSWVLDELSYAVRYRPTGHGDPFLHAWLDRTASARADAAPGVFDELSAERAPGWCVRCHSVDRLDDGRRLVNWHGERPGPAQRHATRFVHRPHLRFEAFRDCTACHSIDSIDEETIRTWKASYRGDDAGVFAASFDAVSRADCARCHNPRGAGDGCLACHQYHVVR